MPWAIPCLCCWQKHPKLRHSGKASWGLAPQWLVSLSEDKGSDFWSLAVPRTARDLAIHSLTAGATVRTRLWESWQLQERTSNVMPSTMTLPGTTFRRPGGQAAPLGGLASCQPHDHWVWSCLPAALPPPRWRGASMGSACPAATSPGKHIQIGLCQCSARPWNRTCSNVPLPTKTSPHPQGQHGSCERE